MKLASVLANRFDDDVRARGASYYRLGAVRVTRGNATSVTSTVRGSRLYDCEMNYIDGRLYLWCDCPYFETAGGCKHLWATIIAADAQNYFTAITRLSPADVDMSGDTDFDDEDLDEFDDPSIYMRTPASRQPFLVPAEPVPAWRRRLDQITADKNAYGQKWPAQRQLLYVIDASASLVRGCIIVDLKAREPRQRGGWKKPTVPQVGRDTIPHLPDPADREILGMLTGTGQYSDWLGTFDGNTSGFRLRRPLAAMILPLMTRTGRCFIEASSGAEPEPLTWDEGEPWQFVVRAARLQSGAWAFTGVLRREAEEMDLNKPALVSEGLVFTREKISRLEEGTPMEWIQSLRVQNRIDVPSGDAPRMIGALLEHPSSPRIDIPEELRFEEVRVEPRPCLTVRAGERRPWQQGRLEVSIDFDYGGQRVDARRQGRGVYDEAARRFLRRDLAAETAAVQFAIAQGISETAGAFGEKPSLHLPPKKLPAVAHACLAAGWHVEAEGKIFRRPGAVKVEVSSGIDWFELHGEVDYGGATAKLPALLAALRRGENMVRLDDGTYGLLPEEWLNRFSGIAGLGSAEGDHLRFGRNQAGLLDALLATQPEAQFDATFARMRDEMRAFSGVQAAAQPPGFVGQLRDYQKDGLGWMFFLRRFGFGGCLADDMGLGKTAQVLAMLEERRASGEAGMPSLVVVPRSLVFNWIQEAARFTPALRVLDYTGAARARHAFGKYDVVLTTYGTLRRDAAEFAGMSFDYIVLDEAQAIKNAGTDSAKAARLLRGQYRLALSGTPVENHLGELWSIFEFLNPGMLGAAGVFKLAGNSARNPAEETRRLLAQALRPFILRRTKEQVARELPPKYEQTIFCELEPPQRKLYNELRMHYRNSLLGMVEQRGLAKTKIQVLEALLRLRQAACHPGLVDVKRRQEESAKLDVLIARLGEVVAEGHKALVFSQFTSLLSLVQDRLRESGMTYEYLDGATRDRQQHVERFQQDPDCPLFLISLKAGGLGLNLTAAEYVFLLDPWWNPAVEAQAVDRAHRIGQTRQVFAFRLIAKDTVEEKILQLQGNKRELAAAIISEDNSLIGKLQREDLELLLS